MVLEGYFLLAFLISLGRVVDTPFAELGFAALDVGAATNGLRPIIEFIWLTFFSRD